MAAQYFINLGFARAANATTPDFLTSLTNPAERMARSGWDERVPKSRDDFVAAWNSSREAKSLRREISQFEEMHPVGCSGSGLSHEKSPSVTSVARYDPCGIFRRERQWNVLIAQQTNINFFPSNWWTDRPVFQKGSPAPAQ